MPLLFPVMREDHGRMIISRRVQLVSTQALAILATQTKIDELELNFNSAPSPDQMRALAGFQNLKSLVISMLMIKRHGPLSLAPLCASIPSSPQLQLSKLKLECVYDVSGIDLLLAHHPLQELHLRGVYFLPSLAPSMRLASSTLRKMSTGINHTYPALSAADFPALHVLEVNSLPLVSIPGLTLRRACNAVTIWL